MKKELFSDLNIQQKEAVEYCEGPQLIVAGPGSGKTRVLTHKIAYLISEKNLSPYSILAVTFTNKAANEIKTRVLKLLEGEDITGIWMGTFHGICARILRIHGSLIGISTNYTIYDTDDSKAQIKSIMKELQLDPQRVNPNAVLSSISSAKSELVTPEVFSKYAYGGFLEKVSLIYPLYEKTLRSKMRWILTTFFPTPLNY